MGATKNEHIQKAEDCAGRYKKVSVRYRNKFFGRYKTEQEASRAYQLAKSGVEYKTRRRMRYMLPKGVFYHKYNKKHYIVRPQLNGKRYFLGYFATAEEAKDVYDNFRQKEK